MLYSISYMNAIHTARTKTVAKRNSGAENAHKNLNGNYNVWKMFKADLIY